MTAVTLFKHPIYTDRAPDWIKWRDLFEGKDKVLKKSNYLWFHAQEKKGTIGADNLRKAREERTKYLNTVEINISLLESFFFNKKPILDEKVQALLGDAKDNIDGFGTSLETLIKNKIWLYRMLFGKVITYVDSAPYAASSRGQEQAAKIRPYIEVIHPLNAVDWSVESTDTARLGHFNFFRHEYASYAPRTRETQEPLIMQLSDALRLENKKYVVTRYKQAAQDTKVNPLGANNIERQNSETYTTGGDHFEPYEDVTTDLEQIPIEVLDGESWIKDVAEETLRYYNLRSSYDNINYYQAYQKIFISGVETEEQMKAITEYTISFLPANTSVQAVESVTTTGLENALAESLNSIFKLGLNQLRLLPADSRVGQSADSISGEKDNTVAMVQAEIEDIENLVNRTLKHYAAFMGDKNFDGEIELNKDISEDSIEQFIAVYNTFGDMIRKVPEIQKPTLKKAVEKLKLGDEAQEAAFKAIDSTSLADETSVINSARQNILNRFTNAAQNPARD